MTEPTHISITHINRDKGYIFSEYDEPISEAELVTDDDGRVVMGDLYRVSVENYGRCIGKVYVDTDGPPAHVGYVFERRERYEDTGEPYLRETWVVLIRKTTTYVGAEV